MGSRKEGTALDGTEPASARIWSALASVPDPEMPVVSVVDLGMVQEVQVAGGRVRVVMIPTFVGCPALAVIRRAVEQAMSAVPEVTALTVDFVLDPPWTSDRITAAGRDKLKTMGIAPPRGEFGERPATMPVRLEWLESPPCPYCGASETQLENLFGPTACRSIYYCPTCRNPFEGIKSV